MSLVNSRLQLINVHLFNRRIQDRIAKWVTFLSISLSDASTFPHRTDGWLKSLRVKNKRELNASLKGATLGDADADTDDTLKWIKKSKKREKLLAQKRMEELENMDKLFQGDEYTES